MSNADKIRDVMSDDCALTREQILERSGVSDGIVDPFLSAGAKSGALIRSGEKGAYFYGLAPAQKRPLKERKKLRDIAAKARALKPNGSALHDLTSQSLLIAAKRLGTVVRECVDVDSDAELAAAMQAFELAERIHQAAGA